MARALGSYPGCHWFESSRRYHLSFADPSMAVRFKRGAIRREFSSAGRASALQAGGHRFEPCNSHHNGQVVQLVRMPACHAGGRRFEPDLGRQFKKTGFKAVLIDHPFNGNNMVGIGKRLSHRVVAPICVGSNPTTHPILFIGVSPSGKATDSDSVMRRFESCYPSQLGAWIPRPQYYRNGDSQCAVNFVNDKARECRVEANVPKYVSERDHSQQRSHS